MFSFLRKPRSADHNRPRRPSFQPRFECLEGRRLLTTLTVLNTLDSGAGSLRAEIAAAHNGDTIAFAAGLSGQTITLTKGELLIKHNLTIAGPGAGQLTVSGNHASRVFEVAAGMQVTLTGLTISNGLAAGANGGGILNSGELTVSGSILSGNSANYRWKGNTIVGGDGGGIYNSGTLTVNSNSTLSGNSASQGGGIDNVGMLTVSNSDVLNNTGSGIFNHGTATISGSILSGNSNWGGAGILTDGTLTVIDSTLSGNSASSYGGGIANMGTGTAVVIGSTLTGNSASNNGGGIFNQGTLTLSSSTLTGNTAGYDGGGVWSGYYATTTVSGSTVSGNSAAYEGGGIWNNGRNTLTVENSSSIIGNFAPVGFGADGYNFGVLGLDSTSTIGILDGNPSTPI